MVSLPLVNKGGPIKEAKAYTSRGHIAIDVSKGIGYISTGYYDFMMKTAYFSEIELLEEREQTIFLAGQFPGADSYLSDIKTVLFVDEVELHDCRYLFKGLENLEEIVDIENLKVPECRSFEQMFYGCNSLKTIDFTDFDVSKCGDFSYMFYGSGVETLDLTDFDTSNGGNFKGMFLNCGNLTSVDLSSFNTRNASDMRSMFHGCASLDYLDISSFELTKSPFTEDFFRGTQPKIINGPKYVPEPYSHDENAIKFDLRYETTDPYFYYDYNLNNYTYMVPSNSSITYYYEKDIKENVVSYSELGLRMFKEFVDSPDIDRIRGLWNELSSYDYSQYFCERDYEAIFTILKTCSTSTINDVVSEWLALYEDLYSTYCHVFVNYGGDFLERCPGALSPDGLVHIAINTTSNIGYIASKDTYEILKSDLNTSFEFPFEGVDSIFSLLGSDEYKDITKVIIQDEVTILSCNNLFKDLTNVESIEGLGNLNTESNMSCASMFEGCSSLETLNFANFDTPMVIYADRMFKNCSNLKLIDSLDFSLKSLVSISEMFAGCSSLTLLDLSNFDLTNVTNSVDCFNNATFFYLKTPKCMPKKSTCNLDFYFPLLPGGFNYYDTSFNTYTATPKANQSTLIISEYGKGVLEGLCEGFIKDCAFYCLADGSTSQASLIKLWEDQYDSFDRRLNGTPSECLMEFFKQDNSSSLNTKLKTFSEKYDYIYGKYQSLLDEHGGDFAQRSSLIVFANNSPLVPSILKSNNTIVIVLIFLTINVGLVFYVIHRKRKTTKV